MNGYLFLPFFVRYIQKIVWANLIYSVNISLHDCVCISLYFNLISTKYTVLTVLKYINIAFLIRVKSNEKKKEKV